MAIVEKMSNYLKEVMIEMKKVTWPGKQELIGSTTVVIVVSAIFSIFLFVVDNILARLLKLLF